MYRRRRGKEIIMSLSRYSMIIQAQLAGIEAAHQLVVLEGDRKGSVYMLRQHTALSA